jgi:hypothetical protein
MPVGSTSNTNGALRGTSEEVSSTPPSAMRWVDTLALLTFTPLLLAQKSTISLMR